MSIHSAETIARRIKKGETSIVVSLRDCTIQFSVALRSPINAIPSKDTIRDISGFHVAFEHIANGTYIIRRTQKAKVKARSK